MAGKGGDHLLHPGIAIVTVGGCQVIDFAGIMVNPCVTATLRHPEGGFGWQATKWTAG